MQTHHTVAIGSPQAPGLLVHQIDILSQQVLALEQNIIQWQSFYDKALSISSVEADSTKVQIRFLILAQINQHQITLIMLKTQLTCVKNILRYKYGN